jgi:SpoVK/Ycf46/Vps4 family AAA+-type ATPase
MQEKRADVFVVATANDLSVLPPELLRKGRFDEIFFVDLPSPAVRESIFAIHLRKRGQDVATFDLPALAAAAEGFSGAEIEQAVVAALYASRAAKTPLTTAMIVERVGATRPLSVVMAEKMAWLRAWASTRTVSAD